MEAQRLQFEYEQSPVVETIKKLVKQGGGHWEGSASDIKEASKYLSWEIYEDVRKIGKLISRYEGLLWAQDGITCEMSRGSGGRKYTFNDTNVTHDTNVTEQLAIDV